MLTFSRAAATEFKQRLMVLIGNAAHFVEIKTFHSYCFDLLGRIGNLEDAQDIVSRAARMIEQGEVIQNTVGNLFVGQVVGDTARTLSERFGKIVQQRESVSRSNDNVTTSTNT